MSLLQLLAGIQHPSGSHLTSPHLENSHDYINIGTAAIFIVEALGVHAHLSKPPLPQEPVLSECLLGDGLP